MKKLKACIQTLLIALVMFCMVQPALAAGSPGILHYEVITRQGGDETDIKYPFVIKITPVTKDAPMPENGDTLEIDGSGEAAFVFDFSESHVPEVYEYRISCEDQKVENFTTDFQVYDLKVITSWDENGEVFPQVVTTVDGKPELGKLADPPFMNVTYKEPAKPVKPAEPEKPSPILPWSPGTGLNGNQAQLIGIISVAAVAVIVLLAVIARKRKHS